MGTTDAWGPFILNGIKDVVIAALNFVVPGVGTLVEAGVAACVGVYSAIVADDDETFTFWEEGQLLAKNVNQLQAHLERLETLESSSGGDWKDWQRQAVQYYAELLTCGQMTLWGYAASQYRFEDYMKPIARAVAKSMKQDLTNSTLDDDYQELRRMTIIANRMSYSAFLVAVALECGQENHKMMVG